MLNFSIKKQISRVMVFLLMSCSWVHAEQYVAPYIKKIEVFADGMVDVPKLNGVQIIAYDLNEITEINRPVRFNGASREQSMLMLKQWLASPDYQAYSKQRKIVIMPLNLMAKYGVSKVPAIVFNSGEFAVYGTTDVIKSINDVQNLIGGSQQ